MKFSLHKKCLKLTTSVIATSSVLMADAALAQSSPDEIIVTGRKKAETVLEAPIAITAFSERALDEAGVEDIRDIADFTPGLELNSDLGRQSERPVIRGIANARAETPQPVSVFVDGIYVRTGVTSILTDNLERVEVLKGPQSALYGRSTYGGVVNYITKDPGMEAGGKVTLSAATDDDYNLSGYIDGPLNKEGTIRGMIGAKYSEYGGSFDNVALLQGSREVGSEETTALYGKLLFEPTDKFSAEISGSYVANRDGTFAGQLIEGPYNSLDADSSCPGITRIAFCGTIQAPDQVNITTGFASGQTFVTDNGIQTAQGDWDAGLDKDLFRLGANIKYETDNGYTVTSLTGFTKENLDFRINEAYSDVIISSPFAIFGGGDSAWASFDEGERSDFYQEIRLSSPSDETLEWLVGGIFYTNEQTNQDRDINVAEFTPDAPIREQEYAVFGRVGYNVTDKFNIGVEGRLYQEEFEQQGSVDGGVDRSVEFSGFSPRITLDYQINPDTLIYGLFAKGNKRGGFNDPRSPAPFDTFEEETVDSFEAGLKSDGIENLTFTIAAYLNQLENQQLSRLAIFNQGQPDQIQITIVDNIGKTEIYGVELDARYDFSDNFYLRGTYALAETNITEGNDPTQGGFFASDTLVGFEIPRVAKHSATLTGEFSTNWGDSDKDVYLRADGIYNSGRLMQLQNIVRTPDSFVLNARVGFRTDQYDFSIFGRNLTDEDAATNAFRYVGLRNSGRSFAELNNNSVFRRGNNVAFLRRGLQVGARLVYNF